MRVGPRADPCWSCGENKPFTAAQGALSLEKEVRLVQAAARRTEHERRVQ